MDKKINSSGLELIKQFEGCKLKSYYCPAGILTIGYGHTGKDVVKGMVITQQQADELLIKDLALFEKSINRLKLNINDNQFSALVCFIYNLGFGSLLKSNLLLKIKSNPNDLTIPGEFDKWVYSSGRKLQGLVERRKKEAELYFKQS